MAPRDDAQITFSTSDVPPQLLKASKATLSANSTVFRDMFSLPNASPDEPVWISETKRHMQIFLALLHNDEASIPNDLTEDEDNPSYEERYIELARMADKYDCLTIRRLIEAEIWKTLANRRSHFAFALAVTLRDKTLISASASALIASGLREKEIKMLQVDELWKHSLMEAKGQQAIQILEAWKSRTTKRLNRPRSCTKPDICAIDSKWSTLIQLGLENFDRRADDPFPLVDCVDRLENCCGDCRSVIRRAATQVEKSVQPVFRFPEAQI